VSWLRTWGRLKPRATPAAAKLALQGDFSQFRRERAREFPPDAPRDLVKRFVEARLNLRAGANGAEGLRGEFERPLYILGGLVALVLLIACANVANLLIARVAAREAELALRATIGAGRGRVLQQVLIEGALLALGASLLGALLAGLSAPAILGLLTPSDDPAYLNLHYNRTVFAFLVGLCALTTLLFSAAPAWRASKLNPGDALKGFGGRHSTRPGLLRSLLAVQMGFTFVVLFVAGLLVLSFQNLTSLDPGFVKEKLILFRIEAKDLGKAGESPRAWRELQERVQSWPGVQAASVSTRGLFRGQGWRSAIRVPGRELDASEPYFLSVSPGFLGTMGIPLLAGRDLLTRDSDAGAPLAVVVNETFARKYLEGNPLGKNFSRLDGTATWVPLEIVGVARDALYRSLREAAPPLVYVPLQAQGDATLEVRAAGDPSPLIASLRPEIPRIHPALRVIDVTMQATLISNTLIRERLLALLSAFFGVLALLLAAVGLYAMLSYGVTRRTKEIGIRLALGAPPGSVVASVLREIALLVALGLALGLATAVPIARLVTSFLFEVRPSDPWSVALPLLSLLLASVPAVLPAVLRAVRVDPTAALRCQ
jgi:predicted permease